MRSPYGKSARSKGSWRILRPPESYVAKPCHPWPRKTGTCLSLSTFEPSELELVKFQLGLVKFQLGLVQYQRMVRARVPKAAGVFSGLQELCCQALPSLVPAGMCDLPFSLCVRAKWRGGPIV